jgi:hypothetical protein
MLSIKYNTIQIPKCSSSLVPNPTHFGTRVPYWGSLLKQRNTVQVLMMVLWCQNMRVDTSLWILFYYLCFVVVYWVHSVGWYTEYNKRHGMSNTKLANLTFTSVLFHCPLSVSMVQNPSVHITGTSAPIFSLFHTTTVYTHPGWHTKVLPIA